MLTKQEIFSIVYKHLAAQGCQSIAPSGQCKYRLITEDGRTLKCAVGALIPDKYYVREIESTSIDFLLVYSERRLDVYHRKLAMILKQSGISRTNLVFVKTLQVIHDQYWTAKRTLHDVLEVLQYIALSHSLNLGD